jgi:CRISPR-associated protein Cas2
MFDLPVKTKKQIRTATKFRNLLLDEGFAMKQFSVYIKPTGSFRTARILVKKLSALIPEGGLVSFIYVTDRQFAMVENFIGDLPATNEEMLRRQQEQLTLF